jgi:hypothetical protein
MWELILVLKLAAAHGVFEADGFTADLHSGEMVVVVPGFRNQANCETEIPKVPTTFLGVSYHVMKASCHLIPPGTVPAPAPAEGP